MGVSKAMLMVQEHVNHVTNMCAYGHDVVVLLYPYKCVIVVIVVHHVMNWSFIILYCIE